MAESSVNDAAVIQAVLNFQEYLRIKSVHPNIDYDECVEFLKRQAISIGIPVNIHTFAEGKPVVVLTWEGSDPTLPSVLLNSHMDVVPVYPEKWTRPPFAAEKDEKGNIYARGSQDMKSVGIQHLEAVRKLKNQGIRLKRTVHISFVPDEEIDGQLGMKLFAESSVFKNLNIGFMLDESGPNPTEEIILHNGEISNWVVDVHFTDSLENTFLSVGDDIGEKVRKLLKYFMDFREEQKLAGRERAMDFRGAANVTTINLTQAKTTSGFEFAEHSTEILLTFDVRIPLCQDHKELEKLFDDWCKKSGPGVYITYRLKDPKFEVTPLDDTNPWWKVFKSECDSMGIKLFTCICPGNTDARFVRPHGIPALGFSPMNFTPMLLHDHNEFLNENIFVKGIHIFTRLISALGNM